MADEPSFTITVTRRGNEFHADLRAQSRATDPAELQLRGIGRSALEAVKVCLTELESKAADGDETALPFA